MLDNDVKAWALAERQFGALRAHDNAVLLSIGNGVGAAVLLEGEIYRGRNSMAGEIGHVSVGGSERLCECGKLGCLEAELSDRAIVRQARLARPEATLDDVFDDCARGRPWACALMERVVDNACIAINLLANAYAPDAIVLCGSLVDRYPVFLRRVEACYSNRLSAFMRGTFELRATAFGAQGGLIGAAALAFRHRLDEIIGS